MSNQNHTSSSSQKLAKAGNSVNLEKWFLLIFHGGLVCYLLLHNLLMPAVKSYGLHHNFYQGIQFFFLPQLILFIGFTQCSLERERKQELPNWTLFFFYFNIFFLLSSAFFLLKALSDGVNLDEFSTSISLIAISIFYLGFFLKFAQYFSLYFSSYSFYRHKKLLLLFLALISSLIASIFHQKWIQQSSLKANVKPISMEVASPLLSISLPRKGVDSSTIELNANGFPLKVSFQPRAGAITIINSKKLKKILFRLEYLKRTKWYLKRVFWLKPGEELKVSDLYQGFFRLRSPLHPEWQSLVIIMGADKFPKSVYKVFPNKVEVEYE